ncbi:MAG: NADP-dependent malic enzyme [Oligoflexales bacterium]
MDYEKIALEYHERAPAGKLSIKATKPLNSQTDLSIAYSPGVAGPCREIEKNVDDSFRYTARGNQVGVITNGTAVLGLGAIGAWAAKPVMEGKAVLFKKFADIDVFDLEVDATDPDQFIQVVQTLEPTFGGINLEDIKAPECFYIEETLRKRMNIPVFHDDQHGTAIIAAAAFLNALKLTDRTIDHVRMVICGAGAAAIGCANLFRKLGIPDENLVMCDSKGVIHSGRNDLNPYKMRFAVETSMRTMEEALVNADAFLGVSTAGALKPEMLKSMAKDPIVFALANPDPEITPDEAKAVRSDVIIATGRSDYPNQVNNVLGFPYIFRGALDARATTINDEMVLAAVRAIADLTHEDVPEDVVQAYSSTARYSFGKDYLIPKPVDQRVLLKVAPAVVQAAMNSGVARIQVDMDEYEERVERILGSTRRIIRDLRKKIRASQCVPHIIVTSDPDQRVLKAVREVCRDDVRVSLVGNRERIEHEASVHDVSLQGIEVIDPHHSPKRSEYAEALYNWRQRAGVSRPMAEHVITDPDYFAAVMVRLGHADGMLNGVTRDYRSSSRPILQVIRSSDGGVLAGVYLVVLDGVMKVFADCTIHIDPTAEQLASIAIAAAETAEKYLQEPIRVAMLSYASFGVSPHPKARKVADAVQLVRKRAPNLNVDGEMQADVALDQTLRSREFPFCDLDGDANVLVFPDLSSSNIAYKLLSRMAHAELTGPVLVGLNKPANIMQRGASVTEITNMIYVTAHQSL